MIINELQKLEQAGVFNGKEISKHFSPEQLIAEINQRIVECSEKSYNHVYDVFEIIRNGMLDDNMDTNVFYENAALKVYYLERVYKIEEILLHAAMHVLGPVWFDFSFEELLSEDDFYQFYIKRHKEYKQNGEATIYKLVKSLDFSELNLSQAELEEAVADLKNLTEAA